MPAEYKYEFISLGRSKALAEASSRASDLYRDLAPSQVVAPAVMERFRVVRLLLGRAAGHPVDSADIPLLDQLLGKDMGEERQRDMKTPCQRPPTLPEVTDRMWREVSLSPHHRVCNRALRP